MGSRQFKVNSPGNCCWFKLVLSSLFANGPYLCFHSILLFLSKDFPPQVFITSFITIRSFLLFVTTSWPPEAPLTGTNVLAYVYSCSGLKLLVPFGHLSERTEDLWEGFSSQMSVDFHSHGSVQLWGTAMSAHVSLNWNECAANMFHQEGPQTCCTPGCKSVTWQPLPHLHLRARWCLTLRVPGWQWPSSSNCKVSPPSPPLPLHSAGNNKCHRQIFLMEYWLLSSLPFRAA